MTKREYAYHLLKRRCKRMWRKHDGAPIAVNLVMSEDLKRKIEFMHKEYEAAWDDMLGSVGRRQ